MPSGQDQSILFEMLRSFTTLARTLNLSEAVRITGTTRQTLRRHIDILEEIRNEKLFDLRHRQYFLTEAGASSLQEAESILARGKAWLAGDNQTVDGLAVINGVDELGVPYYAQQHPINGIWRNCVPLLQAGLQAWVEAKGDIDHPAMDKIRPYLVICRKHEDVWFSVTIGPESSNARWKGPVWAKSAIGEVVTEHLVIPGLDRFTFGAYDKVSQEGGARIDHIYSHIPKKIGGPPMPVTYQRLLLACNFPNGEPAMAALCAGTAKVSIAGLDEKDIPPAPAETLMESEV